MLALGVPWRSFGPLHAADDTFFFLRFSPIEVFTDLVRQMPTYPKVAQAVR